MIKMTSFRARSAFPGLRGLLPHMAKLVPSEHLLKGQAASPSSVEIGLAKMQQNQHQGRLRLDGTISSPKSSQALAQLPREMGRSPLLEVLQHRGDVAAGDTGS